MRYTIPGALCVLLLTLGCVPNNEKTPVDYVNPYAGNISHMLVPTFPTVHLPNSMMRVAPVRRSYTDNRVGGLPVFLSGHRSPQTFTIHPFYGEPDMSDGLFGSYTYDHEVVKPYFYSVYLEDADTEVSFAPSHQSAIYRLESRSGRPLSMLINTKSGEMAVEGNVITGYQYLSGTPTKAYLYMETEETPRYAGVCKAEFENSSLRKGETLTLNFNSDRMALRYGISLISTEQAKRNLYREISGYDFEETVRKGRDVWNAALGKITVDGSGAGDKEVFYTSFYRTLERMVQISEDGRYYSPYDGQIHDDGGIPQYADDWFWDTYRVAHPLRTILEPEKESHMIHSMVRMAQERENFWIPTFPMLQGDTHSMNCNHGVAVVLDAYVKGIRGFDPEQAYVAARNSITEKTLSPWSMKKAGELDLFYVENGYFPALTPGEKETAPEVHSWERRQPVAVTLGTVYNEWCLGRLAKALGRDDDYKYFSERSLNYRKLFNPATGFFHPKDKNGKFIEPFDYAYSGGLGARDAYDENNGWIYRWDVQHNFADLVNLLGGKGEFSIELDKMYNTPIGKEKWEFYAILPDHTGNVGMFSMGNEPCLHIPYLYNYAGQPWKTQKRVRDLLRQWFRDDLMGMPGDEDGGGLSSFVVFSMMGFYPITPGLPMYVIGSPVFERCVIELPGDKKFEILCHNYSPDHKYIQSASLNGREWNKLWISHEDVVRGGKMEFVMGKYPNTEWACGEDAIPPSFEMVN